jgi:hypothetical protein
MKYCIAAMLVLTAIVAFSGTNDPYRKRVEGEKRWQAALDQARAEGFAAGQKAQCKPTKAKAK